MTSPQLKPDLLEIEHIIRGYHGKKAILIPLLQEIQAHYGYVPRTAVDLVAKEFGISRADIYGVLTFYAQFYLEPRGKYTVKVCQGTACYILGGRDILDHVRRRLRIEPDETTADGLFTLETVACLGCCGMGPVVAIGNDLYGKCTVRGIDEIIDQYQQSEEAA